MMADRERPHDRPFTGVQIAKLLAKAAEAGVDEAQLAKLLGMTVAQLRTTRDGLSQLEDLQSREPVAAFGDALAEALCCLAERAESSEEFCRALVSAVFPFVPPERRGSFAKALATQATAEDDQGLFKLLLLEWLRTWAEEG